MTDGGEYAPRSRGFAEGQSGSLHAQWLLSREPMPAQWTASQGTALRREGRVEITAEQTGTVWIGGNTMLTIEGTILA